MPSSIGKISRWRSLLTRLTAAQRSGSRLPTKVRWPSYPQRAMRENPFLTIEIFMPCATSSNAFSAKQKTCEGSQPASKKPPETSAQCYTSSQSGAGAIESTLNKELERAHAQNVGRGGFASFRLVRWLYRPLYTSFKCDDTEGAGLGTEAS
jgi:hypothetical protein